MSIKDFDFESKTVNCDCPCHEQAGTPCPKGEFCCPGRIPASVPNDLFCTPFDCPKRIPTPRFNSPNSSFPPDELEQLQACFEEINDVLRSIGNPRDPENQRQLLLHFRALRGELVRVIVDCDDEPIELLGTLEEAGRNFIQLNKIGEKTFILFERICSLQHADGTGEVFEHEQELLGIDTCTRREITLNFGKIVGRSPFLINLFFGIPLHLLLLQFLGYLLKVTVKGEEVIGTMCEVQEGQIRLQLCEEEPKDPKEPQQPEQPADKCAKEEDGVRTINFNEICFITIC